MNMPPPVRLTPQPPVKMHWAKVLWRSVAIPVCFLMLGGSLWLAMAPAQEGTAALVRSAGIAVALGSLALTCAAGLLTQIWREARSPLATGLALVPGLLLMVAVLYLVRPAPRPAPPAPEPSAAAPSPSKNPLATRVVRDTEDSGTARASLSGERELRACFAQFFDEADKARNNFDAAMQRENLRGAMQAVRVQDEESIKRARRKLKYASTLMDDYYKRLLFLHDDLQSKVQSTSVEPGAKTEVMQSLITARKSSMPQMKEYCDLSKTLMDEAERMLSFIQGFSYSFQGGRRPTLSSADVLTIQLYQERLNSMSDRLNEMETRSEQDVKRSNDKLRVQVEQSLPNEE